MSPSLFSVREVAVQLRVHRSTVYGLCERGALVHVRVSNAIRIRAEAVEAFLKARSSSVKRRSPGKDGGEETGVPSK